MELDKFDKQLRLMVLLTQNRSLTVSQLCERTGINRRTMYRYIAAFRDAGFIVEKDGKYYRLDHRSPFFQAITEKTHFSDDEALTISQLLHSVYDNSPQMRRLREKFSHLYDAKVLASHGIDQRVARNIEQLHIAAREERLCVLRGYSSPHSQQTSDRIVEPYLFLSGNSEVRCYELASQMNKTFKVSRCERVEVLDLLWQNKERHAALHTDLFHFSGERRFHVKLLLGRLSDSLLREEYPFSEREMQLQDDGRTLFETDVCSFLGIGRFVLGLLDDIEVVGSKEFSAYLAQRLNTMKTRFEETQKKKKKSHAK